MLVSQKLAIAAHLHVLLRRKTGRVTDTEWMAENLEYALEIVRFARAKAAEDGHPELLEWADKLEKAALEPNAAPRRPLAQTAVHMLKERVAATPPPAAAEVMPPPAAAPSTHASSGFGHSVFNETGFSESLMEDGKPKIRETGPRYIGGIR